MACLPELCQALKFCLELLFQKRGERKWIFSFCSSSPGMQKTRLRFFRQSKYYGLDERRDIFICLFIELAFGLLTGKGYKNEKCPIYRNT